MIFIHQISLQPLDRHKGIIPVPKTLEILVERLLIYGWGNQRGGGGRGHCNKTPCGIGKIGCVI